jgi:hypothetical protein
MIAGHGMPSPYGSVWPDAGVVAAAFMAGAFHSIAPENFHL